MQYAFVWFDIGAILFVFLKDGSLLHFFIILSQQFFKTMIQIIFTKRTATRILTVYLIQTNELGLLLFSSSVPDPNPDPPDPHVFGSPGSGSIS